MHVPSCWSSPSTHWPRRPVTWRRCTRLASATGRRGVLIVGNSGTGKSTLACSAQCWASISSARTPRSWILRTLRATGLASYVHLHEGFVAIRGIAPRCAGRSGRPPSFDAAAALRNTRSTQKIRNSARIGAIGPLRSGVSLAACRADRFAPAACGSRAGHHSIEARAAYAAQQPGWNILAQSLRRIPAFELRRGGHPREAASAVRALLGG